MSKTPITDEKQFDSLPYFFNGRVFAHKVVMADDMRKLETELAEARAEIERLRMLKEADKEQRRERLATAIMAGIYANPAHAAIDDKMAALCAIDGADALIKALEATGKPELSF